MFWKRSKPKWSIDPARVAFGSVVGHRSRNLSRTHVRVKYGRAADWRFVPMATFALGCQETLRDGGCLDIEHLLVAPILKRRFSRFFDDLTDWGPATRRAYAGRHEATHRSRAVDPRLAVGKRYSPTSR